MTIQGRQEKWCFSKNTVPPVGGFLDLLRKIQGLRCFFAAHDRKNDF